MYLSKNKTSKKCICCFIDGQEKAQVILHYLILQLLNNFRFVFANFS